MPNWCEGNIRLRGKRAAIMDFLRNELACTGYRKFPDGLESHALEIKEYGEEVELKYPQAMEGMSFPAIHIKGTRRNFIEENEIYLYLEVDDRIQTAFLGRFKAAWDIETEPYLEKAKKYGVDISIIGFERGMQFAREIEIVDGNIKADNEITYDDWEWECPMPHMGG